ncbi:hypothetical protein [Rhodopila sp.]|uniref:hypothetical protein n=1 Tax=Rhodopila sp. TaxID=2480087 RepID=UPI003D13BB6C
MKMVHLAAALLAGGVFAAAPAMAQTTPQQAKPTQKSMQTAQKQHTQEGPSDGGFDRAGGIGGMKQHTQEGPSDGGFDTGPASRAVPK